MSTMHDTLPPEAQAHVFIPYKEYKDLVALRDAPKPEERAPKARKLNNLPTLIHPNFHPPAHEEPWQAEDMDGSGRKVHERPENISRQERAVGLMLQASPSDADPSSEEASHFEDAGVTRPAPPADLSQVGSAILSEPMAGNGEKLEEAPPPGEPAARVIPSQHRLAATNPHWWYIG